MRNCFVLLIALALPMVAQTVRVPFVGCGADTQLDPVEPPKGTDKVVQIGARRARRLAYYKAEVTSAVIAPVGWYCYGIIGSGGFSLFISPRPINALFGPGWRGVEGPSVEVDEIFGGTSGRFDVAQVLARVFPKQRAFVQSVIDSFDQPANTYTFGPYPKDKLIVQSDRLVQFQTAPHSEGLGTLNRLQANDDPIDGVAMLQGETPDLLILRVRLPRELRALTPTIIHDLLVRQSRDAR
jgi:hypothetical protein